MVVAAAAYFLSVSSSLDCFSISPVMEVFVASFSDDIPIRFRASLDMGVGLASIQKSVDVRSGIWWIE